MRRPHSGRARANSKRATASCRAPPRRNSDERDACHRDEMIAFRACFRKISSMIHNTHCTLFVLTGAELPRLDASPIFGIRRELLLSPINSPHSAGLTPGSRITGQRLVRKAFIAQVAPAKQRAGGKATRTRVFPKSEDGFTGIISPRLMTMAKSSKCCVRLHKCGVDG